MPVMKRLGLVVAAGFGSTRCQTTEPAAASALSEMNTRPVPVAAQSVPAFVDCRRRADTALPARPPQAADVRSVVGAPPILTKSPQPGWAADVVNSGQFASRNA